MSRNPLPFPDPLQEHLRDADDRDELASVWRVLRRLTDAPTDTAPPTPRADAPAEAPAEADRHADPEVAPYRDPNADLDAAWDALRQRTFGDPRPLSSRPTDDEGTPASPPPTPREARPSRPHRSAQPDRTARRVRSQRWLGAAAAAVLLLIGAAVWWQQPVTVQAPSGAQVTATLPDGSTVELNSGTTLRYPRGFQSWPGVAADRRTVELEGEAFFSVTHGDKPFEVRTFNTRIEVLGTAFNVRGRSESESTEVVVASGRVRVAPFASANASRPDAAVVLDQPGQSSRVTHAAAAPSTVDVDRVLAWRRAGFAVSDQPLAVVARELERRYNLTVRLTSEARAQGGSLSLYYNAEVDPETIVHDLCTARGLSYRPISNGYEIYVKDDAPR
jgi:ferric-dicitrate binding protein FerR (iron transport regulator)